MGMPSRKGTAEGGIRPCMRQKRGAALCCWVLHHQAPRSSTSRIALFLCGTLKVIVLKEANGLIGNIWRQPFVLRITAQQCATGSSRKAAVRGGMHKSLCPLRALFSVSELTPPNKSDGERQWCHKRWSSVLSMHGCSQQPEVLKCTSGITYSSIWKLSRAAMRHSCLIILGLYPLPLWSCQWPFSLLGTNPSTPPACHSSHTTLVTL